MIIRKITPEDWSIISEKAHRVCFKRELPKAEERIDFVLLLEDEKTEMPLGYISCRELGLRNLYWQFGGAFPGFRETYHVWEGYKQGFEYCRGKYDRISTYIENTNTVMLKMAMKVGFRVIGVKNWNGHILLEHMVEL